MQIIECTQQTDQMRQSSKDNHEMENLMATTIYIVFQWVPPFRNLNSSKYVIQMLGATNPSGIRCSAYEI
jgi:hypothetical protein